MYDYKILERMDIREVMNAYKLTEEEARAFLDDVYGKKEGDTDDINDEV